MGKRGSGEAVDEPAEGVDAGEVEVVVDKRQRHAEALYLWVESSGGRVRIAPDDAAHLRAQPVHRIAQQQWLADVPAVAEHDGDRVGAERAAPLEVVEEGVQ